MNKHILTYAAALAMIAAGSGCDYNEDNFEGLQDGTVTSNVITLEMTLADADYKAIADNKANKTLAGDDQKALSALTANKYFTPTITAAKYVPNFLAGLYPAADNTSSIKVTSNFRSGEVPETVAELQSAEIVKLADEAYQTVWGADSENKFFSPSESAEKHLPAILKATQTDAAQGDLLWVEYNVAETEPSPSVVAFTETFDSFAEAWDDNWSNVVTNGNEKSAKWVFKTFSGNNYLQCSSYKTTGETEVYLVSPAIEVESDMTFTFDACYGNYKAEGGRIKVLISADLAAGAATAESIKAATWTDITSSVDIPVPTGTYGTLGNVCTYAMNAFVGKTVRIAFRYDGEATSATTTVQVDNPTVMKGVKTPYSTSALLCSYNGSAWSIFSRDDVRAIVKADYLAMGSKYDSFDASFSADNYLPTLLRIEYPYAQPEDTKFVAYKYYDSSSKTRSIRADEYVYDGTQWVKNDGITTVTDQFVKNNNVWVWDPSVTIILPVGKNEPLSTLYFQACVDWVKENVKDGAKYVTSYGNNEYYTGASAYQGNLDWRVSAAREQYAEGYAGMSDDEVTAALKQHTIEVFAGVLGVLHPDAKAVAGVDVTYTLQFGIYNGTTTQYRCVYKVIGDGKFEYVEDSFQAL